MRPAQKAPENAVEGDFDEQFAKGFNEAGAKSAGKPLSDRIKDCGRLMELQ